MTYIISIISVLVSFFIYRQNRYLLSGGMEIKLREYINTTKTRLSDMLILKSNTNSEKLIKEIDNAIDIAIEENLNAYEEACAKYIDNKVDRERFRKMYNVDIRTLIKDENYSKYFEKEINIYELDI